jgi:hypothetical protein
MTRAQLLDLFTPIYDEFAMMAFDELSLVYPKIFDVIDDPTKDYKHNSISGLGAWDSADEDSEDGLDHFVMGYEGSDALAKYRKYFYVTFEVNEQIEYAILKSKIVRAEALGRGGRARAELLAAAVLYNGFTTACDDGQYLWDNDHPKNPEETGIVYDNLLSGAFSHDNLELAEAQIAANYFDMDGLPIARVGKPYIVYAPALAGVVGRVLAERADERPGTPNRDINLYSGKYIPLEWDYLGAALGGSDTAWYIIFPGMKMFKFRWGQKPQYSSWIDDLKQRYYFDGWQHCEAHDEGRLAGFASTGL